jgi:hypothetical protein
MTGVLSMSLDRSFTEQNRAATNRIRTLVAGLSEAQLQRPVGEHWTVAIALAHLAFWDQRVLYSLEKSAGSDEFFMPTIDLAVNELLLPFWAALPPQTAVRLAIETAEALDNQLEAFPFARLEALYATHPRWVVRALHRNEHLDEVEAALNSA